MHTKINLTDPLCEITPSEPRFVGQAKFAATSKNCLKKQIADDSLIYAPLPASSRLISLVEICKRINRSQSWAYANAIVPLFNANGTKKQSQKHPPYPWLELPSPLINFGKRGWLEASIEQWLFEVGKLNNFVDEAGRNGRVGGLP